MTTATHVPLSELAVDAINVRKTDRGAEPQFTASIRAKGIIEPLVVRRHKNNGYTITNGSKRFDALLFLKDKGDKAAGIAVTGDYPVPITVRQENDTDARDTSLITNIIRAGMHPADEAEAFAQHKESGRSIAEIAGIYGIDEKRVRQRLALGSLAPVIMQAWRAGTLSYEAAQAFTLAPSKKEQEKLFKQLSADGQGAIRDYDIKEALKADENDGGRFAAFVGIDAYVKRGGKVSEDLFGTDHVVSNWKLAQEMANEKLDAECDKLVKDGWSFALVKGRVRDSYNYSQLKVDMKTQATPEEVAELERLDAIVSAEGDGEQEARDKAERLETILTMRAYTPAQKARSGCFVSIDHDGQLEIEPGRVQPAQKKEAAKAEKSEKKASAPAGKTAPAPEPKIISNALKDRLNVSRTKAIKLALAEDVKGRPLDVLAVSLIAQLIEPIGWRTPDTVRNRLSDLANAVTPSIMKAQLKKHFDAKDYFSSAPKGFVLKAITDAMGADHARKLQGKTKAETWKFALANVAKTDWLPPEMRTANYDGPGRVAKTQAKKKSGK